MNRLALLLGLAALALAAPSAMAQQAERPVVVELFTSQGCSSCPAADKVVEELAPLDDVIALSFNVDYWDYIGWKDTLASPDYTARQHGYAEAMGSRRVYTPQLVINGVTHVVGSDRRRVTSGIERQRDADAIALPVSLTAVGDKVKLAIGAGTGEPATIWLVQYDNAQVVDVGRGENAGRTLTYANVARTLTRLGEWSGEAMELTLDAPTHDGCVVLVQRGRHGPILGAARLRANPAS